MKQLNLLKTLFLLCALVVGSLNSWADDVTFNYEDYKGEGTTSTGSTYTMVKPELSIKNTKFFGNNSNAHFYGNGVTTITPASGISITKIVLTATSTKYNGYQSDGTITASTGTVSGSTSSTTVTWTGSASSAFTISNDKQIRWTSIVVTYESIVVVDVTGVSVAPTSLTMEIGDTETLTPTVAPDNATNKNVTWESDDEDVATVDDGVVTAVGGGTCAITVKTVDGNYTATCTVTVNGPALLKPAITWDFATNIFTLPVGSESKETAEEDFTYNGYTIKLAAADGYYWNSDGYVMLGKSGSTLTFPAFNFNVSKITVKGTSGASTSVTQNIFVGADEVSTETTGARNVINEYEIAAAKQAAGTIYKLKVTSNANTQISKIEIYGYEKTSEVTAAGYATYVTKNNVKFAEGDAYAVTVDGSVAKLTPVTQVRNNVPVLLKGAGIKNPVVLANAPAAITTDLKVSTGGDPADAYVLANKGGKVGFYKWNGGSLTSGKVYLYAPGLSAHEYIAFDGEESGDVTGINEVAADKTFNGEFFNLAGQRVAQPTKGLYIVNGKKVIIK